MRILKKYKSHVKKAKKILAKSNLMLLGNGRGSLFAAKYLNMDYLLTSLKQLKFIVSKFVHLHASSYHQYKKSVKSYLISGSKNIKKVEPKFKIVIVCENDKAKEAYLANYVQKLIRKHVKKKGEKELDLINIICTRPISEVRKFYRTGHVKKALPSLYFATNDAIFLELKKLLGSKVNVSCSLVYNKELYSQGYWSLPAGLDTWFFFKYQLLFLISYIGLLLKKKPVFSSFSQPISNIKKGTKEFQPNRNYNTNYKNKNSFDFKKDYKKNKYSNKNLSKQSKE